MLYGKKIVHNVSTGEKVEVDLTPEEISDRAQIRAAAEAHEQGENQVQQKKNASGLGLADIINAGLTALNTDAENAEQDISAFASMSQAERIAAQLRELQRGKRTRMAIIKILEYLRDRLD